MRVEEDIKADSDCVDALSEKFPMVVEQQDAEKVLKRIPKNCPFCKNIDNVAHDEFEVRVAYPFYSTSGFWKRSSQEPHIGVFCTRCLEEIREEDIK